MSFFLPGAQVRTSRLIDDINLKHQGQMIQKGFENHRRNSLKELFSKICGNLTSQGYFFDEKWMLTLMLRAILVLFKVKTGIEWLWLEVISRQAILCPLKVVMCLIITKDPTSTSPHMLTHADGGGSSQSLCSRRPS
ncbi:hypothetical protein Peur_047718 [Populus x canadensis]